MFKELPIASSPRCCSIKTSASLRVEIAIHRVRLCAKSLEHRHKVRILKIPSRVNFEICGSLWHYFSKLSFPF